MKRKRSLRRLLVLFGVGVVVLAIALDLSIAGVYVRALTWPGCIENPKPQAKLPAPQEIWLTTDTSMQIRAWYYPPQNGHALLLLGGWSGSLGQGLPSAEILIEAGYGALQIDSRNCAKPSGAVTLGALEPEETAAGLRFLRSQPEVQHVGAMGFSMGGATVLQAAAQQPEIEVVIAEGNFLNFGQHVAAAGGDSIPGKIFSWTVIGFYRLFTGVDPMLNDPLGAAARIGPRPVLLIYGEYETGDGRGQRLQAAAGENAQLWIAPGGSHGRNYSLHPEAYRAQVLRFLEAWKSSN